MPPSPQNAGPFGHLGFGHNSTHLVPEVTVAFDGDGMGNTRWLSSLAIDTDEDAASTGGCAPGRNQGPPLTDVIASLGCCCTMSARQTILCCCFACTCTGARRV